MAGCMIRHPGRYSSCTSIANTITHMFGPKSLLMLDCLNSAAFALSFPCRLGAEG